MFIFTIEESKENILNGYSQNIICKNGWFQINDIQDPRVNNSHFFEISHLPVYYN